MNREKILILINDLDNIPETFKWDFNRIHRVISARSCGCLIGLEKHLGRIAQADLYDMFVFLELDPDLDWSDEHDNIYDILLCPTNHYGVRPDDITPQMVKRELEKLLETLPPTITLRDKE